VNLDGVNVAMNCGLQSAGCSVGRVLTRQGKCRNELRPTGSGAVVGRVLTRRRQSRRCECRNELRPTECGLGRSVAVGALRDDSIELVRMFGCQYFNDAVCSGRLISRREALILSGFP